MFSHFRKASKLNKYAAHSPNFIMRSIIGYYCGANNLVLFIDTFSQEMAIICMIPALTLFKLELGLGFFPQKKTFLNNVNACVMQIIAIS